MVMIVWYLELQIPQLATASDKVYQLLGHVRRFSPGTPASSTTKTGRHDIAERGAKRNKSTTTYAISVNYHLGYEFKSRSWRGVLNTTLCGKVHKG